MSTPAVQTGILSTLNLNGGTFGSPSWSAVGLVGDLKLDAKWDVAEYLIRAFRVKFKQKTALDLSITGKLLASLTNASYTTMLSAMLNDDILDVMCLNGPSSTNGVRGYRFEAQIIDASEDQGPTGVVWNDFALVPVYGGTNAPKSVLVTTGAPVFTSLA